MVDFCRHNAEADKISKNKWVQQLKLSTNVNKNCCSPNPIFSNGSHFQNRLDPFWPWKFCQSRLETISNTNACQIKRQIGNIHVVICKMQNWE